MLRKNQNLFIAQFVATVCVVIIHSGTIAGNPAIHFVINNIICRIAVPFFFICNAYFFRLNCWKDGYVKSWLEKMLKVYSMAFILYIPFGIELMNQSMHVHWSLIPFALICSFFYCGSFYHLWYIPALIFSLFFVKFMLRKFGFKLTLVICLGLFMIGSLETYSAFISNPLLGSAMQKYFALFLTTRNGLFFSPIFVLIGNSLAANKEKLEIHRKKLYLLLILSSLAGIFEGLLIFKKPGIDKNFMYFTIFFTVALFGLLVTSKKRLGDFEFLKSYSQSIYFLHMIPIQLFNIWYPEISPENGLFRVIIGLLCPILMRMLYQTARRKLWEYLWYGQITLESEKKHLL